MKKIGILTGGGDCPGLNPAIRGCVLSATDMGFECLGIMEGWKGLIQSITQPLTVEEVEPLMSMGGTMLGSSRTNPYKQEGGTEKCVENIKKLGLYALVAMGGEDTLGVANKLYKEFKINVVGVPKTMDNDLSSTDYTFGFDSSVTVAVDAASRLKDTGRSHRRIMVLEVMGRHAGWVALFTGLAAGADWTLVPEEVPDIKAMCAYLKKVHEKRKTALVIVSEGIKIPGSAKEKEKLDEFGHMLLKKRGVGDQVADIIKKDTGIDTRAAVIGHIQRGGAPTVFDRILGLRAGVKAAQLVSKGDFGKMVALRGMDMIGVSLDEAVAELKTVSGDWMALSGIGRKW